MEGAILFSEAHTIAMEHPDAVLALREILWLPGELASPSQLFSQRMAMLAHPGPVQDAAFAHLRDLQEQRPTLSYLEAMGLLLSAASPANGVEPPEPSRETVDCVSRVFDRLVEQWPMPGLPDVPEDLTPSAVAYADPVLSLADEPELGSALSRALARSAWEDAEEQPPRRDRESHSPPSPYPKPQEAAPVVFAEGEPFAEQSTPEPVSSYNFAGETEQAYQPQTPTPAPEVKSSGLSRSSATVTSAAASEWRWDPRLLILGTLLFGAFFGFLLFRYAARSNVAAPVAPVTTAARKAPSPARSVPPATSSTASTTEKSIAPSSTETASRNTGSSNSANNRTAARSLSSPQPEARRAESPASSPDPPANSNSLVPMPRPVSLGAPNLPNSNEGRLPGVTVGSAGVMAANVLVSPAPAYPAEARAAHVQGEVIIEAVVGKDGDVLEARVVSGPVLLQDAAKRAVQHWRYRPYLADGKPAEILATARIEFRLR